MCWDGMPRLGMCWVGMPRTSMCWEGMPRPSQGQGKHMHCEGYETVAITPRVAKGEERRSQTHAEPHFGSLAFPP